MVTTPGRQELPLLRRRMIYLCLNLWIITYDATRRRVAASGPEEEEGTAHHQHSKEMCLKVLK